MDGMGRKDFKKRPAATCGSRFLEALQRVLNKNPVLAGRLRCGWDSCRSSWCMDPGAVWV